MRPKIAINCVLFLVHFCADLWNNYFDYSIPTIEIIPNKSIESYQYMHILITYEFSVAILHTLPNVHRHQHYHHQHSIRQCKWLSHKLEYVVARMIIESTLDCLPTRRCMMCACSITFTAIIMYSLNRKCDLWASYVKISLMKANKINKSKVYTYCLRFSFVDTTLERIPITVFDSIIFLL